MSRFDEQPECAAEIERLNAALHYEEHRSSRIGTHGPSCWKWGPSHYECALVEIDRLLDDLETTNTHHDEATARAWKAKTGEEA